HHAGPRQRTCIAIAQRCNVGVPRHAREIGARHPEAAQCRIVLWPVLLHLVDLLDELQIVELEQFTQKSASWLVVDNALRIILCGSHLLQVVTPEPIVILPLLSSRTKNVGRVREELMIRHIARVAALVAALVFAAASASRAQDQKGTLVFAVESLGAQTLDPL